MTIVDQVTSGVSHVYWSEVRHVFNDDHGILIECGNSTSICTRLNAERVTCIKIVGGVCSVIVVIGCLNSGGGEKSQNRNHNAQGRVSHDSFHFYGSSLECSQG